MYERTALAFTHANGQYRIESIFAWNEEPHAHRLEPGLERLRADTMSLVARAETLGAHEAQSLVEGEDARNGRGVMVLMLPPKSLSPDRVEAPVTRLLASLLDHLPRGVREGDEGDTGDGRETFLAASHHGVETPAVHLERHRAERDHRIDNRERVVFTRNPRDLGQLAIENPTRRLPLNERHDVESPPRERDPHHFRRDRAPGLGLEHGHIRADASRHLSEATAERAGLEAKHAAARPQEIRDGHLHGRRSGTGDAHELFTPRLKRVPRHVFQVFDDTVHRLAEVVDDHAVGARDRVRDWDGPGSHEKERFGR
jgi:hypothetical protein